MGNCLRDVINSILKNLDSIRKMEQKIDSDCDLDEYMCDDDSDSNYWILTGANIIIESVKTDMTERIKNYEENDE